MNTRSSSMSIQLTTPDKEWITEEIRNVGKNEIFASINAELATLVANAVNEAVANALNEAVSKAVAPLTAQIEQLTQLLNQKNENITQLESKIIAVNKHNVELRSEIIEKTNALEQYSRKDSLRLEGLPIAPNEDNDSLKTTVVNKLSELGVELEDSDIFRLHRSGKPHPMNKYKAYVNRVNEQTADFEPINIDPHDKSETTQVLIKFTNWNARSRVYQLHYKKGLAIRVKCDLTKASQDILNTARTYLKDNHLNGYVYNDAECRLILADSASRKRTSFTSFLDFKGKSEALGESTSYSSALSSRGRGGYGGRGARR